MEVIPFCPDKFTLLKDYFVTMGVAGNIIDRTPYIGNDRGEEIHLWLDEHEGVSSFVIIDDVNDMGDIEERLVQTQLATGIQDDHVAMAIKMLGAKT